MRNRMQTALWARIGLIAVVVVAVSSMAHAKDKRKLVVMTQNLYLGSSLDAAIGATTPEEFLVAVAQIYKNVIDTDFPARAQAIADQIADADPPPDIIGLQEVSLWTTSGPIAPSFDPAVDPIDFLNILLAKVIDDVDGTTLGDMYEPVETSYNANIGPIPVLPFLPPDILPPQILLCADFTFLGACTVSLQDRDVILVKKNNPDLEVFNAQSGRYAAQAQVSTPVGPLFFDRGWASVDGTFEGKKFRFLNTHLEIGTFAAVQEAQGQEFLAGPAKTGGAVIAVGDFNSRADGSSTTTYADLTKSYFDDAWDDPDDLGFTCCQDELLDNEFSDLRSAIDFVFTHAPVTALTAEVVGGDIPVRDPDVDPPPFWPSDHAGVIATVRIH